MFLHLNDVVEVRTRSFLRLNAIICLMEKNSKTEFKFSSIP